MAERRRALMSEVKCMFGCWRLAVVFARQIPVGWKIVWRDVM